MDSMERKILNRERARLRDERQAAEKAAKIAKKREAAALQRARSELRIKIPQLMRRLRELEAPDVVTFQMKISGGIIFRERYATRAGWELYSYESSGGYSHQGVTMETINHVYLLPDGSVKDSKGRTPWNWERRALPIINNMINRYGA